MTSTSLKVNLQDPAELWHSFDRFQDSLTQLGETKASILFKLTAHIDDIYSNDQGEDVRMDWLCAYNYLNQNFPEQCRKALSAQPTLTAILNRKDDPFTSRRKVYNDSLKLYWAVFQNHLKKAASEAQVCPKEAKKENGSIPLPKTMSKGARYWRNKALPSSPAINHLSDLIATPPLHQTIPEHITQSGHAMPETKRSTTRKPDDEPTVLSAYTVPKLQAALTTQRCRSRKLKATKSKYATEDPTDTSPAHSHFSFSSNFSDGEDLSSVSSFSSHDTLNEYVKKASRRLSPVKTHSLDVVSLTSTLDELDIKKSSTTEDPSNESLFKSSTRRAPGGKNHGQRVRGKASSRARPGRHVSMDISVSSIYSVRRKRLSVGPLDNNHNQRVKILYRNEELDIYAGNHRLVRNTATAAAKARQSALDAAILANSSNITPAQLRVPSHSVKRSISTRFGPKTPKTRPVVTHSHHFPIEESSELPRSGSFQKFKKLFQI
ncbi:hypothetical protein BABINDRAFT_160766 [Babjeviella inositovora NRRL Y-12698]|uniref:Uncharacterized protein n=1 Tax=Babjeviella inositovora NRRL Y-12698 TaxID=984486 RepID=A0A1E3QRZ4_9ASCO|nr:uncharacterized protein BABINDRAFT_160766 [Babjeviella inositovora NRRL Y-12698]ODQ80486.1 hypothetical protein BABINDRAFT_160766 [Babjeviella inositovora NRRL Y-12698]